MIAGSAIPNEVLRFVASCLGMHRLQMSRNWNAQHPLATSRNNLFKQLKIIWSGQISRCAEVHAEAALLVLAYCLNRLLHDVTHVASISIANCSQCC